MIGRHCGGAVLFNNVQVFRAPPWQSLEVYSQSHG